MYADFLTDRCDIYHLRTDGAEPGYGLPAQPGTAYPDEPDEADVPCHFNRGELWEGLYGSDPRRVYPGAAKLQLPLGTDVRVNDRIVDRANGLEYTASVPRIVGRNHHIAVKISRLPMQEAL